ncbi:putative 2-dehydropantoate 2-reductase [Pontiellaceae bacterium B12219]|nr:putative 2-dehydropantoate 2-reductase [Pontiellaceae bacterium B12219]
MQNKNQFSIVGTGAVGGYYGGLLQQAGFDVHFLLNRDAEHVRTNGLRIDSGGKTLLLPTVQAYSDAREMPRCDVVLVTLKTTSNAVLKEMLPHLVKEDGVVLTLQNGLGIEKEIADIVGPERVLGGLCFLCSNKIGPGHIHHLDYGLITLGEYRADGSAGGITPRLNRIAAQMETAGIPIRTVEDLAWARWKKLVWNIPFNGLSVVRNELTDQLIKNPETRSLCATLMQETAAAANACCRPIEPEFLDKMMSDTEKMQPYAPSMKLDFDRGNPMEIEAIYGNPLRAAEAAGIDMPETRKLYEQLLALNPVV